MEVLMLQVHMLTQALWACYIASGADTDGDTSPDALVAGMGLDGFAQTVVRAVRQLQADYDTALQDDYVDWSV